MTITNVTDRELAVARQFEALKGVYRRDHETSQAKIEELRAEVAELKEKLKYITLAFSEWIEKTQWVQDTIQPGELGMHRADVIKSRFDELQAKLAEVPMTTVPNPRVIEIYDSHHTSQMATPLKGTP